MSRVPCRPSVVDFAALTHVIHFSVWPKADGTLNTTVNSITPSRSNDLISRGHAAGKRCSFPSRAARRLVSGVRPPTPTAGAFISNLCSFMSTYGYDGIDIDWEPLASSDALQYTNFIKELRVALNAYSLTGC